MRNSAMILSKTKQLTLFLLVSAFSFTSYVHADETLSLDTLLNEVKSGLSEDRKENKARIAEFKADKASQAHRVEMLKAKEQQQTELSSSLEKRFSDNEQQLAELDQKFNERLGSLKELFGVFQQISNDSNAQFADSLTQIQFPERATFLQSFSDKMGQANSLPDLSEIEHLWFELQRQMIESGKVTSFNTQVVDASGQEKQAVVTRIGVFNLVSGGKYYQYMPKTGRIVEYTRQPSERYLQGAELLTKTVKTGGTVPFAIDPSRGQLLSLLVQAPNLEERIENGGVVGYVILGLGVLALLVALERFITLSVVSARIKGQQKHIEKPGKNPLGRIMNVYLSNKALDTETLELKLSETVLKESLTIQKRISFIKIIAVISPLLGLLGTVVGMIITFQAITLFGAGDPKLMSGGISQALVTTVQGLVVAIPAILLHALVQGKAKAINEVLEQQAIGMVAEQSEHQAA